MGRRLRALVGSLKDTASIGKAAILCATPSTYSTAAAAAPSSPDLAVLLATPHHPSSAPPPPHRLAALLAFGRGSRPAAAALSRAIARRLSSTRDAAVALKCLLAARHILRAGPFILRDQLIPVLRPAPLAGGRSPLHLAAFRDASSPETWALSAYVRWIARLLELLLSPALPASFLDPSGNRDDGTTALLTDDLLREIDALVGLVEEAARAPDAAGEEGSELAAEAVEAAAEDRFAAEREIMVRVKEVRERLGSLGFAESVELVCVLRRLVGCKDKDRPSHRKWTVRCQFWSEVEEVRAKTEALVVAREGDERRKVMRDRASESARIGDRAIVGSVESVRFGSSRWMGGR